MKKYRYELIVFICGAMSMALELVAARIFSPYVGSSNLVWTTIIGMILIFMSLGYYIGGKVADKKQDINILKNLIRFSTIYIAAIPIFEVSLLKPFAGIGFPLVVTAVIMSVALFGIPSFTFALVSPFSVKLKQTEAENKDKIGEISGKMSSLSTIGSILGTFITGFLLIPLIGSKGLILLITILLEILLFTLEDKINLKVIIKHILFICLFVALFFLGMFYYKVDNPDVVKDVDSEYSRIQVKEFENIYGDTVKYMAVGNQGAQSIQTEKSGEIGQYLYYYDLSEYFIKDSDSILMIGGAAYTYPTYFYKSEGNKERKIDVVEIDETMTKLAVSDFGLDLNNPSLGVIHQDGRSYINYTDKKYDTILVDAFKGESVPFELTTYEAAKNMYNILEENGLVITNVISSLEGKDAKFLEYEYSTYKAVFDDVKVYKVIDELEKNKEQNIILVGFKGKVNINESKYDTYKDLLDSEVIGYTSNRNIVTDNLAQIGD